MTRGEKSKKKVVATLTKPEWLTMCLKPVLENTMINRNYKAETANKSNKIWEKPKFDTEDEFISFV